MAKSDNTKGNKRFIVTEKDTGEQVEGYGLIVQKRAPHPYRDDGVQIRQKVLRDLATHPQLTKRALRIALWLLGGLRKGPRMPIMRQDIANALDMDNGDVTKGLQELFRLGLDPDQNGVVYSPFLPPSGRPQIGVRASVAWKGQSGYLKDAIDSETQADESLKPALVGRHPSIDGKADKPPAKDEIAPQTKFKQLDDDKKMRRAISIIEAMEAKGQAVTLSTFRYWIPEDGRPEEKDVQKLFSRLLRARCLFIWKKSNAAKGSIYATHTRELDYHSFQVLKYIRVLAKKAEPITIRNIRKEYHRTNRPVPATVRKYIQPLIGKGLVEIKELGTGRSGTVYSYVDLLPPPNESAPPSAPRAEPKLAAGAASIDSTPVEKTEKTPAPASPDLTKPEKTMAKARTPKADKAPPRSKSVAAVPEPEARPPAKAQTPVNEKKKSVRRKAAPPLSDAP